MARQSSIITVRGKIGNVVGMKNGFGTPTGPFIREYISEIKNPQSDFQMDQRAKMLPAVLFRRQLESVISRAWEGKKYGGPSTREFMKYALKEPWENIPQLPKDSTNPIPGAYLISKGSLAPMYYFIESGVPYFDISSGGTIPAGNPTISEVSIRIETRYPAAIDGDQITFVVCRLVSGFAVYSILSFYLDSTNNTTLYDFFEEKYRFGIVANKGLMIDFGSTETEPVVGFAVVHSREKNNTYQRSTQRFLLDKSVVGFSDYFASTLKEEIASSYRTAANSSRSNWEYEEQGGASVRYISVTLESSPEGATLSGGGRHIIGDSVTVVAPSSFSGLTFAGWYLEDARVSTSASYTFEAVEDVDLRAVYEDRP